MPRVITFEFKDKESSLASMELKVYGGDELRNHGAPCSLTVHNRSLISPAYWDNMRRLEDSLNATPDTCALRPSEVRPEDAASIFNAAGGRHVLAGGDSGTIDSIRRADVALVAAKALRELRALGLIAEADYKSGLSTIEANGLPAQESLFRDHRSFQPGTEKTPMQPKP
jgi:hypothetical protein